MAAGQHNNASIIGVIGASGSGKSLYVKTVLLKPTPKKLLIWNYQAERGYSDLCDLTMSNLADVAKAAKKKEFSISFIPNLMLDIDFQFDLFCRIASACDDVTVVVEELSFVTTATHAPKSWRAICAIGRHTGMTIIGVAQRPSQVDKTFFSQCTTLRSGRLNFAGDQKVMADVLSSNRAQIGKLKPLEFIEKDMTTGKVTTGFVKIPKDI